MKKVCIIGLGYVGLPTALLVSSKKVIVNGYDINNKLVKSINNKKLFFKEDNLNKLFQAKSVNKYFKAYNKIIESDIYVITVPTPIKKNKTANLNYVEKAFHEIAKILKKGNLIILESTCPIGTTEKFLLKLKKLRKDLTFPTNNYGKSDINLAYCPERVLPGNTIQELILNNRIIGGVSSLCSTKAKKFYNLFVLGKCITTNSKIAEMAKLSENAFRDINIAFANQLNIIAKKNNINIWEVINLANLHPRVNIHKPGPGVGGHCIAVDPWFLLDNHKSSNNLISSARLLNDSIPNYVIKEIKTKIKNKNKKINQIKIACFGLSYKAEIDDTRESPSIFIINKLIKLKLKKIFVVDPFVKVKKNIFTSNKNIIFTNSENAIKNSDIILFLVDHKIFKKINKKQIKNKIIIDTKGLISE